MQQATIGAARLLRALPLVALPLVALPLVALPLVALAQTAAPPAPAPAAPSPALKEARMKMRAACAEDMQKFCANVQPGNGARQSCLREHRAELSPACRAARSELRVIRRKEKG
jgi:hypothetical protein